MADDCIPAAEEIARATSSVADEEQARPSEGSVDVPEETEIARASTSGALEENKEVRATASVVREEIQPNSSAPSAPTPTPILPSASDVKKTKGAERAAVKKRKASAPSDSSAPKKMKKLTSSFANPIDVVPVSSMPSKEIVFR